MINRICISINNRCNLGCKYCHFHEKGILDDADMDVFKILDNVKAYAKGNFKIGFVGNGEGLLDWPKLKSYITYLENYPNISIYTITNGTVPLSDEDWRFLDNHNVNVGFSIDGYRKCGYSKKFLEEHRQEILLHKAAKNAFDELEVKKLPKVKELNAEYAEVLAEKKKLYGDYRQAKKDMQEIQRAKYDIDQFLKDDEEQNKERTRKRGITL